MKYSIILASVLLVSCLSKAPEITGLEGKMLPDFSLQMPDSTSWINTKDITTGQPTVFFLFSSHCPYCKSQLTKIEDNIASLKDISIYMVTDEPFDQLKQFYEVNQLSRYPSIKVGRDTSGFFGEYIGAKGIPFLALYDKDKRLERAFAGPTSPGLIRSILVD